jgi:hypothetical protein
MPTEADWVRLAAYIETEGSIFIRTISSKRPLHELHISVVNTDPRLAQWCKDTFNVGCAYFRNKQPNGRRATYEWIVSGSSACTLLQSCLDHFVIKREPAALGIAFHKTKTRACDKGGVPQKTLQRRKAMLREMKRLELEHFPPPITGSEDRAETVDEDMAENMDLQISLWKPNRYLV